MTINNRICSMQKYVVVAGLYVRPAEFVVSMRPVEYIETSGKSM